MSLLDEEDVFQKVEDNLDRWKNSLMAKFRASDHEDIILTRIGYRGLTWYEDKNYYENLRIWIDENSKWVELKKWTDIYCTYSFMY